MYTDPPILWLVFFLVYWVSISIRFNKKLKLFMLQFTMLHCPPLPKTHFHTKQNVIQDSSSYHRDTSNLFRRYINAMVFPYILDVTEMSKFSFGNQMLGC